LVRAIDRGLFRLVGRGDNVLPLCTDLNAARAIVAAAHGRVDPGVILVADAEPYPMRRVHAAIARALGRRPPRMHLPLVLARAAGWLNETVSAHVPGVPTLLTRARVRTLVADQPFDVRPLLRAGVAIDAPLEAHVRATVDEQRASGVLKDG
jgi:nucleoside-diphosphate-sugar epimerase